MARRRFRRKHDRVGTGRDGLGHLTTSAHAAIADDRHVYARALEVFVTRGGHAAGLREKGLCEALARGEDMQAYLRAEGPGRAKKQIKAARAARAAADG